MYKKMSLSLCSTFLALTCMGAVAVPLGGTPADPGVINKEQVLYWLIKRGEVATDATDQQKDAAVASFIQRSQNGGYQPIALEKKAQALRQNQKKSKTVRNMSIIADKDITKTVKVMAVLVDFPDLPYDNNGLSAADTGMFYNSYPSSHYQDLLFSQTGFNGPQSQTLQSAYQYFQAASGQSFFFTGQAYDWVRADNNAAYYGGNENNTDRAVPELVKEAVVKTVAGLTDAELASYDIEDPYDLDGDGNFDEPDGMIDHIMLFHSSIGEEAGGGMLGEDAIWSHRFFVDSHTTGYTIPGRDMKIFGYTVQPIDAAVGVCTHEFGHDLGLPDEYDINTSSEDGSPVGAWSLMSGGSWTGSIPGAQPSGFSPYARSYLQQQLKGKWVNEQVIPLSSIGDAGVEVKLHHAVESDQVNQLSINLPSNLIAFKAPYAGEYQYYSGQGHMLNNRMSFELNLPTSATLSLVFKAHWNIEQDYDYMQVLINNVALIGNHTKSVNAYHGEVNNFISGRSNTIAGAEGADAWVELNYDLSAYSGQNVTVEMVYVTDQAEGDYGIAIDELVVTDNGNVIYQDNAETVATMSLAGFSRISDTRPAEPRRYLVQLRSHLALDSGLQHQGYEPGVLMWLEDLEQNDNNSSQHAGSGLIGVIDADQNLIGQHSTTVQIRDAAFSLFPQGNYFSDNHLDGNSLFDDSLDYSAPLKPQSGIVLPELGLTMEVIEQAVDSTTATVRFKRSGVTAIVAPLNASATSNMDQGFVTFTAQVSGGDGSYSYQWDFGDAGNTSSDVSPSYTYSQSGIYNVTLTVTDASGASSKTAFEIQVVILPKVAMQVLHTELVATLTAAGEDGFGELSYQWDLGDGNTSSAASLQHTYAQAGTYTVKVTVTDELGNSAQESQTINVAQAAQDPAAIELTNSGDSGGSVGWLSMLVLLMLARMRKTI
ncbi:immune inhibitor A domain-containing protein [Shewanella intestini]|uniref:M6 family metalloprotease domain-containing protein n=1 Tax=Shewanella intestini TaxID=2017544 RepID=A0ABS5I5J4_9GAMM|nr:MULTISPECIES: immune inhibitor A domain-containing protein [Shewanella]MBR9729300.1 M6 family metalloprotease domain-containing protein [Shewanella intestini]MRG37379.1 M6 family metalloprotease domain-containing protein [Shewanella sp. XMDDZSB0408]